MAAAPGGMNRFYLLLGSIAVAGIGALAFLAARKPAVSIPANPVISVSDTSGFRGYILGSDSAPLEVTEYADFECPACQQWAAVQFPTIEERLIRTGKVRWRYRDLPLEIHPHSRVAAHAAACADEQGQYWPMNQKIYSWEGNWPEKRDAVGVFREYARGLGLDVAKWDACMESGRYAARIQASAIEAQRLGVPSTPTFYIGGRLHVGAGAVHYDWLKAVLDSMSSSPAK